MIIRELVFGNSSGGTLTYTEPKAFANMISQYSEKQIKDMVSQFYQLRDNATEWSKNYDKAPETYSQMELKKKQENILATKSLECGIGKYSNASSARTTLHSEKSQKSSSDWWIGIIIVLLLILLIWWLR